MICSGMLVALRIETHVRVERETHMHLLAQGTVGVVVRVIREARKPGFANCVVCFTNGVVGECVIEPEELL